MTFQTWLLEQKRIDEDEMDALYLFWRKFAEEYRRYCEDYTLNIEDFDQIYYLYSILV